MHTSLLQVGAHTYVNPKYITRIEPSCDFEDNSWVHTIDGKYVETESGYTPEVLAEEIKKLDVNV